MRNEIVKSLIFLKTYVKMPVANFKGPIDEKEHLFKLVEKFMKQKKKNFSQNFYLH